MKNYQFFGCYYFIALFSILTCCCAPSAPQLPFEEKIVVRALLEAGQNLSDVQISRTIPPLDEFSYEKIFLGDAVATISVDGTTYPMELQPRTSAFPYRSLYRVPNLRVEAGKLYALEVRWKNLIARAQTFVPLLPDVDSVVVVASILPVRIAPVSMVFDTVFVSSARIRARAKEVYRVGTSLHDASSGRIISGRGFGDAILIQEAQTLSLQTNSWRFTTATIQVLANTIQTRVNIEAYDAAFYDYYQTRSRNGQVGLFSPGGPNIDWNVTGDGIGEFSGMSLVQRPATVRVK